MGLPAPRSAAPSPATPMPVLAAASQTSCSPSNGRTYQLVKTLLSLGVCSSDENLEQQWYPLCLYWPHMNGQDLEDIKHQDVSADESSYAN